MSYDFKKISDLELVNEVPEGANVLIETEGATKRLPSTAINNGYSKDEVYNKTEAYSKDEVYNKTETDEKFLTKETIAKPDWNQNDPEAADYVKNRSHWSEVDTIVEEQTISGFVNMENSMIYAVPNPFVFSPIAGDRYTVHWDGIAYDVEVQDLGECGCLGNENYLTMNTGGDIPFAILVFGDDEIFIATESTANSHTICIEGEVIHKLDPKYLPDGIGSLVITTYPEEREILHFPHRLYEILRESWNKRMAVDIKVYSFNDPYANNVFMDLHEIDSYQYDAAEHRFEIYFNNVQNAIYVNADGTVEYIILD